MERHIVGWFEIYTNDIERAKRFYETVFAVSLTEMEMPEGSDVGMRMLAFPMGDPMSTPGAPGALVKMDGFDGGQGGTVVYFSCDDCALEESRVEAAGGEVLKPKESIGEYGFMSLVKDTEGNVIGLHSMS